MRSRRAKLRHHIGALAAAVVLSCACASQPACEPVQNADGRDGPASRGLHNIGWTGEGSDAEAVVRQYLQQHYELLRLPENLRGLRTSRVTTSPGGTHVYLQQFVGDIPVYGAQVAVSVDNTMTVRTAQSDIVTGLDPEMPSIPNIPGPAATTMALQWLGSGSTNIPQNVPELVFIPTETGVHLAWVVHANHSNKGPYRLVMDAHTGDVLYATALLVQYLDATGTAFDPDPRTTLMDNSLEDMEDSDYPAIQGAYTSVTLLDLDDAVGGLYRLTGRYAASSNLTPVLGDDPGFDPVQQSSPVFAFHRDDPGFEEVVAYYHIDTFQRYIQSLGFQDLLNYAIEFDAHNGIRKNAMYNPDTQQMVFGDADVNRADNYSPGVDFAEDPDVIVHEYAHAIQHAILPDWWAYEPPNHEMAALAEGYSDYIAVSYRRTDPNGALFYPDRCSPWALWQNDMERELNDVFSYPDDIGGTDPHDPAGVLWASTLVDIEEVLGDRDVVNSIALESMYHLTSQSNMLDGAHALVTADIILYDGAHTGPIVAALAKRGFFPTKQGPIGNFETWGHTYISGDFQIESGLTLLPGSVLSISANQDGMASGEDTQRVEGGFSGVLTSLATNAAPCRFVSSSGTPGDEDWVGLTFTSVTPSIVTANLDWLTIENARAPVKLTQYMNASSVGLSVSGSEFGIQLEDYSHLSMSAGTSTGGLRGVVISDSGVMEISGCEILSDVQGVRVNGGDLQVYNTCVIGSQAGLQLVGGEALLGPGTTIQTGGGTGTVGVKASYGASIDLDGVAVEDAETGIYVTGSGSSANLRGGSVVDGCTWGLYADSGGELTATDPAAWPLWEAFPLVTVRNASMNAIGLWSTQPAILSGVRVEASLGANWTGIQIGPDATATLEAPEIVNLTGSASGGNSVGIFVEGEGTILAPSITNIDGPAASGIFITSASTKSVVVDATTSVPWSHGDLQDCYYGIRVDGSAQPKIRGTTISNHHTCVSMGLVATPDLGQELDPGNNIISNALVRLAGGKVRLAGLPDVSAAFNWWGSTPPDAGQIASWVDYMPYLGDEPYESQSALTTMLERVEPIGILGPSYPVPSSGQLTIPITVAESGGQVRVAVYDIHGRKVKTLMNSYLPGGIYRLVWRGEVNGGGHAPSGVYFIRAEVGRRMAVQKVVLAK